MYRIFGFNSIVVRLKARGRPRGWPRFTSFNSIVVRLKANRSAFALGPECAFQFHSGSIKSATHVVKAVNANSVSIP